MVCGCGVRPLQNQCAHTCVCGSESGCAVCVRATRKRVATHPLLNSVIGRQKAGELERKTDNICGLDTVQDFVIKVGIKPRMHPWKINILSLNSVIARPTKIMNRANKNWAHF